MNAALGWLLLALQAFQVAFLWVHDWIPLGRLNDVAAVRGQDTLQRLVAVTLVQSVPFTIGLIFSAWYLGHAYPSWLTKWLWISYGILFVGQMRAWWVPYLLNVRQYAFVFAKAQWDGAEHSTHSASSIYRRNAVRFFFARGFEFWVSAWSRSSSFGRD